MVRILAAAVLVLTSFCASAEACIAPRPYETESIFRVWPRTAIVHMPEVIVEGVVDDYRTPKEGPNPEWFGVATMRINRVWKGKVASSVALLFQTASSDCTQPPPFGQRLRFGARILDRDALLNGDYHFSQEEQTLITRLQVLVFPSYPEAMYMPPEDSELDRLLEQYQTRTAALEAAATSGDRKARLDFATHLGANNEFHRAVEVYEALLRDSPDDLDLILSLAVARSTIDTRKETEAALVAAEQKAPKTDAWRRKIAHARFAATGKLTSGWKDWSGLRQSHSPGNCFGENQDFDDSVFDDADLSGCIFRSMSFRGASFRGTDLSWALFMHSDLTGAKYDCATKLPDDLDPVAAGMTNVEATCKPTPP